MRSATIVVASLSLASITPAFAEKLGDHPAVIVQRLHAEQGYDFASKFYPHRERYLRVVVTAYKTGEAQ
jgi:hypothetical protein